MTDFTTGNLDQQKASDFKVRALEALTGGRLEVKRPDILYTQYIPLESFDNNVDPGATDLSAPVDDWAGSAAFRAIDADDVPNVSFSLDKVSVPIFNGGVGAKIDRETFRRDAYMQSKGITTDLPERVAKVSRIVVEYLYEKLFFFGDQILDEGGNEFFPGLLNNPLVPQSTVATGASASTLWSTKTPDEKIFDIEAALDALSLVNNTVDSLLPNTIYLPWEQYNNIGHTKAGTLGNDQTVLKFIKEQGLYPELNGNLVVKPLRYLKGAGAAGTDRMIVLAHRPEHYMLANPIDYDILEPQLRDYGMKFLSEFKVSPLHFPWPTFMSYSDGI